jgi:xanthine dehydrogenase small subunit
VAEAIRFWHRGRMVAVDGVPATTTVLDWLRSATTGTRSTGTKEGCNQGDCGACTVAVGDLVEDGGPGAGIAWHAAESCLLLLPMLHGRALLTVEDLAAGGRLHAVQQALVHHNGTQCGFCTPGIVMSLWCLHEQARAADRELTRQQVADGLAGNLCRCTGYRSIVDAAMSVAAAPATGSADERTPLDVDAIVHGLRTVPPADVLDYRAAGTAFLAPTTATDLVEALATRHDAMLVAGGTDLVASMNTSGAAAGQLVWTGRVRDLAAVDVVGDELRIGGAVTLERAWSALVELVPSLATYATRFAGPAVRATGTMAGNLATGSPIGDAAPVLLALDARLLLMSSSGERVVELADFATGYRDNALGPGEIVARIVVPLSATRRDVRAYKVSRRFDSDISTLSAAFALSIADGVVVDARVAFGGLAGTVRRALPVEEGIVGSRWDRSDLAVAQEALDRAFAPISDHRASAGYRRSAARGLLERWWLQTRTGDPVPVTATEVWGRA